MKIETKKKLTKKWFIKLQNIICSNIEQLEKEYGSNIKFKIEIIIKQQKPLH